MQCPNCGNSIHGKVLFCPNCGYRLAQAESAPPTKKMDDFAVDWDNDGTLTPRRQGCGLTLTVALIAFVVVVAIFGLGAAAVYYGLMDRTQAETQAADEHYAKGVAYLDEGNVEMAIAELELAVQLDPDDQQAIDKLAEARQTVSVLPTATQVLREETSAAYLQEMREAYQREDWAQVLEVADRLIAADPSYRRDQVDEMLFVAYYATGTELVQQDRMREAVAFFDRALELQPDDPYAQEARELAALYLDGMAYWAADWAQVISSFEALYKLSPSYKDVRERLFEAHVNYGDVLNENEDWCAAQEQYAAALAMSADATVSVKEAEAEKACAEFPSGGQTTDAPAGTFVGHVVQLEDIGMDRPFVRGHVYDKDGDPVVSVSVKIQAWDWSALAVTDGSGQFSFDGLRDPVTYTLSLPDLTSVPLDVPGVSGKMTWVEFSEAD